jgi:hypothetical protein
VVALGDTDTSTNQGDVVVKQWDSATSSWTQLGSGLSPTGSFDLKVDAAGAPLLAWPTYGPWQVVVSRWDGASWSEVGRTMVSSTPGLGDASVAADAAGNVFVAWDQPMSPGPGMPSTYTPQLFELPWTDDGSPAASANHGLTQPSLVVDATGPVLAWLRYPTNSPDGIVVDRWSGSAWMPLGSPIPAGLGHQLIVTALAVASTGSGHGDLYEWQQPSWTKICSLADPHQPMQLATGVTGVALGQDGNGNYLVAAVNAATREIFVEKVH